jgi:energy-coupling factor transport system permease protein
VPGGAAFLATTALRFVPVALEEWRTVRRARVRRVSRAPAWRVDRRLEDELSVLRPVIARAIRRSATLAESLEQRGFDPVRAPIAPDRPAGLADRLALAAMAVAVLAVVGSRLTFWAWTRGVIAHPSLRPWRGFVRWWC